MAVCTVCKKSKDTRQSADCVPNAMKPGRALLVLEFNRIALNRDRSGGPKIGGYRRAFAAGWPTSFRPAPGGC